MGIMTQFIKPRSQSAIEGPVRKTSRHCRASLHPSLLKAWLATDVLPARGWEILGRANKIKD